jgi:hypothetical protein
MEKITPNFEDLKVDGVTIKQEGELPNKYDTKIKIDLEIPTTCGHRLRACIVEIIEEGLMSRACLPLNEIQKLRNLNNYSKEYIQTYRKVVILKAQTAVETLLNEYFKNFDEHGKLDRMEELNREAQEANK